MRIRTIKPGFFTHEEIAELSPLARLMFIGLWCMADVAGRLEDRPKRIKVEVLPYDKADPDALLNEIQARGFITRYEAEGVRVIQVENFEKHQRISGKEAQTASEYPVKQPGSNCEAAGDSQEGSGCFTESQEGKGREGKGTEGEGKGGARASQTREAEQIYEAYPKKTARQDALRAIEKALKIVPHATLLEAVTAYSACVATWAPDERQFIPNPATWFNDGRWDDDRATWVSRYKVKAQTNLTRTFDKSYYEEQA